MFPASGSGSAQNCPEAVADSRLRTKPGPATTAPPSGRPATLVGQRGRPGRPETICSTFGSTAQPEPSSTETPPLWAPVSGFSSCQVVIASSPAKATEVKTGGVSDGDGIGALSIGPQRL